VGHELLAGAGLPDDQGGAFGGGGTDDLLEHRLHPRGNADDGAERARHHLGPRGPEVGSHLAGDEVEQPGECREEGGIEGRDGAVLGGLPCRPPGPGHEEACVAMFVPGDGRGEVAEPRYPGAPADLSRAAAGNLDTTVSRARVGIVSTEPRNLGAARAQKQPDGSQMLPIAEQQRRNALLEHIGPVEIRC